MEPSKDATPSFSLGNQVVKSVETDEFGRKVRAESPVESSRRRSKHSRERRDRHRSRRHRSSRSSRSPVHNRKSQGRRRSRSPRRRSRSPRRRSRSRDRDNHGRRPATRRYSPSPRPRYIDRDEDRDLANRIRRRREMSEERYHAVPPDSSRYESRHAPGSEQGSMFLSDRARVPSARRPVHVGERLGPRLPHPDRPDVDGQYRSARGRPYPEERYDISHPFRGTSNHSQLRPDARDLLVPRSKPRIPDRPPITSRLGVASKADIMPPVSSAKAQESVPFYKAFERSQGRSSRRQQRPRLPPAEFDKIETNVHILQVIKNPEANYESRTDVPFERILKDDAPSSPYRRRKHEFKSCLHWGQRKLLFSEIEFLALYGDRDLHDILYVGAAPGSHLPLLLDMFPELRMICVDPAPFSSQLNDHDRVVLRQELFTDELAEEYANKSTLFVCDMRSGSWHHMSDKEVEEAVNRDQESQMRWHNILKPHASMLKFRLPYGGGNVKYLDGDVYLPVWGPITTSECRLVVRSGAGLKEYDAKRYEDQMFHFNTRTRVARYKHDVKGVPGMDFCYDCKAEVEILRQYLIRVKGMDETKPEEICAEIANLSNMITRRLGGRTLEDPNVDPGVRNKNIARKQYIDGKPAYFERKRKREDVDTNASANSLESTKSSSEPTDGTETQVAAAGQTATEQSNKESSSTQQATDATGPPAVQDEVDRAVEPRPAAAIQAASEDDPANNNEQVRATVRLFENMTANSFRQGAVVLGFALPSIEPFLTHFYCPSCRRRGTICA